LASAQALTPLFESVFLQNLTAAIETLPQQSMPTPRALEVMPNKCLPHGVMLVVGYSQLAAKNIAPRDALGVMISEAAKLNYASTWEQSQESIRFYLRFPSNLFDKEPPDTVAVASRLGRRFSETTLIRGIAGIRRCTPLEVEIPEIKSGGEIAIHKEYTLLTEGVAFSDVLAMPEIVNTRRTVCNDVWENYDTLGLLASSTMLFNQVLLLMSTGDVYINARHIRLVTDSQVFRGRLNPISRNGLRPEEHGTIHRFSFEQPLEVLYKAAAESEKEPLLGVPESIFFGQLAPIGTGQMDIRTDPRNADFLLPSAKRRRLENGRSGEMILSGEMVRSFVPEQSQPQRLNEIDLLLVRVMRRPDVRSQTQQQQMMQMDHQTTADRKLLEPQMTIRYPTTGYQPSSPSRL
jgi:hypothetical protein